jgi:hypothetical protein
MVGDEFVDSFDGLDVGLDDDIAFYFYFLFLRLIINKYICFKISLNNKIYMKFISKHIFIFYILSNIFIEYFYRIYLENMLLNVYIYIYINFYIINIK